jgi:Rps23 Pro-64 3,4-dihydroxylase Tpa1-like proline 4-hydroxylase
MINNNDQLIKYFDYPTRIWTIENFFDLKTAEELSDTFYKYDDERWLTRNHTEFEDKLLSTHWDWYPKNFYKTFFDLASQNFINILEELTGIDGLIADYGLHAGGMHLHKHNGRLNLHKDAAVHPKLGLWRKLNIIVYLNKNWEESWGGELEYWNDVNGEPGEKILSIPPMFNTAVIFETDNNFWHGLPANIAAPDGQNRQSIAMFYYIENDKELVNSYAVRAMFAPTDEQKNDPNALRKIKERMETSFKYGR